MWAAFTIFAWITLISLALIILSLALWAIQLILERFILITLPILTELYGRIRYPEEFSKDNSN